jgi:hypothetical protein
LAEQPESLKSADYGIELALQGASLQIGVATDLNGDGRMRYFKTTKVAYWYFRLNGFLTMENFVVHPELRSGGGQRTDADLYGVRFPYRTELNMPDDAPFLHRNQKPLAVIVEVTRGECKLNGPWTNRPAKNVEYVLGALGFLTPKMNQRVASSLYEESCFEDEAHEVRLVAVGAKLNEGLKKVRPQLVQLTLADMLRFIYQRFDSYRKIKADHSQWDEWGHALWDESEKKDVVSFVDHILGKLM